MHSLVKMYSTELKYYKNLLELTGKLLETIKKHRIRDTENLLLEREKIFGKITGYEKRIKAFYEKLKTPRINDSYGLSGIIEEIRYIICEVKKRDETIKAKLKESKSDVLKKIKNLRKGHKLIKGYLPPRAYIPRYIDRHG